jgi:hypothetical protein
MSNRDDNARTTGVRIWLSAVGAESVQNKFSPSKITEPNIAVTPNNAPNKYHMFQAR